MSSEKLVEILSDLAKREEDFGEELMTHLKPISQWLRSTLGYTRKKVREIFLDTSTRKLAIDFYTKLASIRSDVTSHVHKTLDTKAPKRIKKETEALVHITHAEAIIQDDEIRNFFQEGLRRFENIGVSTWQQRIDSLINRWNREHKSNALFRYVMLEGGKRVSGNHWSEKYGIVSQEDFARVFRVEFPLWMRTKRRQKQKKELAGTREIRAPKEKHTPPTPLYITKGEDISKNEELSGFFQAQIREKADVVSTSPWQYRIDTIITAWNKLHPETSLYKYNVKGSIGENWRGLYAISSKGDFLRVFGLGLLSPLPEWLREKKLGGEKSGKTPPQKKEIPPAKPRVIQTVQPMHQNLTPSHTELDREGKIQLIREIRAGFYQHIFWGLSEYRKSRQATWNPESFRGIPEPSSGLTTEWKDRDLHLHITKVQSDESAIWEALDTNTLIEQLTKNSPNALLKCTYDKVSRSYKTTIHGYHIWLHLPKKETREKAALPESQDRISFTENMQIVKTDFMTHLDTYLSWYHRDAMTEKIPKGSFNMAHMCSLKWDMKGDGNGGYILSGMYAIDPENIDSRAINEALHKFPAFQEYSRKNGGDISITTLPGVTNNIAIHFRSRGIEVVFRPYTASKVGV